MTNDSDNYADSNNIVINANLKHPGPSSAQGERQLPALQLSPENPDHWEGENVNNSQNDDIHDVPTLSPGWWSNESRLQEGSPAWILARYSAREPLDLTNQRVYWEQVKSQEMVNRAIREADVFRVKTINFN